MMLCEKKHRFHVACIGRWHDDKGLDCPICRQQFAWTLAKESDGLTMTTVLGSNRDVFSSTKPREGLLLLGCAGETGAVLDDGGNVWLCEVAALR